MPTISLKAVLLCCLNDFLIREYKEVHAGFIGFSCNEKAPSSEQSASLDSGSLDLSKISIKKKADVDTITYTSALPQILRASYRDRPALLSPTKTQQLIQQLNQFQLDKIRPQQNYGDIPFTIKANLWRAFKIESQRPGWIVFKLSWQGLLSWLQQLRKIAPLTDINHKLVINQSLFGSGADSTAALSQRSTATTLTTVKEETDKDKWLWQVHYTYSRCWTLLKQGRQSGRVHDEADDELMVEVLAVTNSVSQPWIDSVWILLDRLVEMADALFWIPYRYPTQQYFLLLKRASLLCQAFDHFYGAVLPESKLLSSTIFSTTAASQKLVVRVIFILITATRNILNVLLREYLSQPLLCQL